MKQINKELLEELLNCEKIFNTEFNKLSSILYYMNNNDTVMFKLEQEDIKIIDKILKRNGSECQKFNNLFLHNHLFSYVDESNEAITKNSPDLCIDCYRIAHPNC